MRKLTRKLGMAIVMVLISSIAIAQAWMSTSDVAEPLPEKQSMEINHGPTVEVPKSTGSRAIGDDCLTPIVIGSLPFTDLGNTTCGRGNNYDATCLGSYDGGEDIVYQLVLTEAKDIQIIMQTASTWTGLLITTECPIGNTCVDYIIGYGGNKTLNVSLAAGTYYIMIDTWPSPNCIPSFDLTVQDAPPPPPGATCDESIDYGFVNGPPVNGSIQSYEAVWYSFTADKDYGTVEVSLCGSAYDTKLEVWYECDDMSYAYYNDDNCGLQSRIFTGPMDDGQVWYAKVYGFSSSSGNFELEINGTEACIVDCPPDAIPESELCGEDLNGGCNMVTPAFEAVTPGDIVCGTTFASGGTRDTDWFELTLTHPRHVILHVESEALMVFGLLDYGVGSPGNPVCPVGEFLNLVFADPCTPVSLDLGVLPAGKHWIFAGLTTFNGFPCDVNYTIEFEAMFPPPVPVSNWALYISIFLIAIFVIIRFRRIL
jgi:hypothetical protein